MTNRNGLIVGVVALVLAVVAYTQGWIKIPALQTKKEEPMVTVKQLEQAKVDIRNEIQKENKITSLEAEVASLKTQLTERTTAATEAESANTLTQDKLAEVQEQLNDLNAKIEKMGSCCTTDTSCMDNCMAGCKEKCANKKVVVAAPVKRKVVKKVKVTPCRETSSYLTCVSERERTWDMHCSKPEQEVINTKIVDKYTKKGSTKTEMQAAIIKIDKEPRHAMCMTPRSFYASQCDRIICGN